MDWNQPAMDVSFCEHQRKHSGFIDAGNLLTESYYFSKKDGVP